MGRDVGKWVFLIHACSCLDFETHINGRSSLDGFLISTTLLAASPNLSCLILTNRSGLEPYNNSHTNIPPIYIAILSLVFTFRAHHTGFRWKNALLCPNNKDQSG